MRNKTKKILISIVLGVYILTTFFQSAIYGGKNTVYAAGTHEEKLDYTNIVAIIVNDDIYSRIESDVKWYATNYIQGAGGNKYTSISNSKALVFPINVDNFSAKNIAQLLENMYFDGISGQPSKLVGVVLIGDIPLPVVNQNGYIFPTVYPYVDFEEQKFIWDDDSKYFVYNNNPNGQAEIWHGLINFGDDVTEYKTYFNKLKSYLSNPSKYIGKAIRYEDFVGNNKFFNDNSLNFYLNNFIFAEDLGYHRYSDLMIKVLQGQRNKEMEELMESLGEANGTEYTGLDVLAAATDDMNTPTTQIKTILDNGYLSSYSSLFGQKYLKTITSNVETANRWLESRSGTEGATYYLNAFDSVYKKAEVNDQIVLRTDGGLEPFIIMLNNALEEAVDKKVEEEKYRLDEVIPLTYLHYEGKERELIPRVLTKCVRNIYDAYENYFFGENAKYIKSMEDASTYRGTYRNYIGIDGVTINDIQNSKNPATDIDNLDLNKKSIGGSYEIFATQVDANRGYNYNNSMEESEIYSGNKTAKMEYWDINCVRKFLGICVRRRWSISDEDGEGCDLSEDGDQGGCEDPTEYALRVWGGASPLNLDMDGSNFSWKSGYSYTGATSKIFDIAGSTALPYSPQGGEYESNSFEAVTKYSSLILRKFSPDTNKPKYKSTNTAKKQPAPYGFGYDISFDYDVKFANKKPRFNGNNSVIGRNNIGIKTASSVDYFENYEPTAHVEGQIIKIQKPNGGGDAACLGAGEIYTYRTLDSRVKNDSINSSELNGGTYKVFEDDVSPVKQFYNELTNLIDSISGTVNSIVGSDSGSLKNNLQQIKNTIDTINSGLNEIISLSTGEIATYDSGVIEDTAASWSTVFNENSAQFLSGKIKEAQNGVADLSGFVDMGGTLFVDVADLVTSEKMRFISNRWNLIFLNSWKEKIYNDISNIVAKYATLQQTIVDAKEIYDSINDISTNHVLQNLYGKLNAINEIPADGSGCNTQYESLCSALTGLIYTYVRYATGLNSEIDGINNLKIYEVDDEGNPTEEYEVYHAMFARLIMTTLFQSIAGGQMSVYSAYIHPIQGTGNADLIGTLPGMNMTTSDRPIDSPRYLTFKGIGGEKVTFIYPDLYKAEIFSGDSNNGLLTLKSTGEIKLAIQQYLRDVVDKYNDYLGEQLAKRTNYYQQNASAFRTLDNLDKLANPNHVRDNVRPYTLFTDDYLIERLEDSIQNSPFFSGEDLAKSDPIGFIASMIYYQNVARQVKTLSGTIQGDFDNQRGDFDINEKVSYLMDNYLVKDNNKGNFLTPDYRDDGYEVAYINSDGNDRIMYENTPDFVNSIQGASNSYVAPIATNNETTTLEEELLSECNIPEDGGVLLFKMDGGTIETPWFDALKCRWEKIKEKPLEFKLTFPFAWDTSAGFWDNMGEIFNVEAYENIGNTYLEQLKLLDTDDINNDILTNLELSHPGDAANLWDVYSYTITKLKKSSITADELSNEMTIRSDVQLGNVDFHIVNIGATKAKLLEGGVEFASNITMGMVGFHTGKRTFDPYNEKTFTIEFEDPVEGLNVIVIYLCLPGTQDLSSCIRHSEGINIVPGEVKNVSIDLEKDVVLEGASVPFKVRGTDRYGNDVGEIISQRFTTSSSSGNLTLGGIVSDSIKFSNFDKANFDLNATGGNLDGKTISIQVSGSIDSIPGVKASKDVDVIKGKLDIYSGSLKLSSGDTIITGLTINLPDKDVYFVYGQPNTGTLPQILLQLVDKNGNIIDYDGKISAKTKNNLVTLGDVIPKNSGDLASGYKFSKTNTFYLSGGLSTIYLSPTFKAGEELLYISMPGIDDIRLPIYIKHANPRVLSLSADKYLLNKNSSTNANLKIFDNWNNIIDDEGIIINLGVVDDKISLSRSGNIIVTGSYDFDILSHEKGGLGYVYATISTGRVPIDKQRPDTLAITIQEKMLPETGLNIMYLNLFGNDRGNQWGYMSDNEKYSESLIKNSEKLITITTQLMDYENIKYYPIIIDKKLHINNIIGSNISLYLASGFLFNIDSIGTISASINSFTLEKIELQEGTLAQIEEIINTRMSRPDRYKGKNVIFYIPERTDSIITSNTATNSSISINDEVVFDIRNFTFGNNLTIQLSEEKIAGYQVWQLFFGDSLIGKMVIAVDNEDGITINLTSISEDYGISEIWTNGTSDSYGIGFYGLETSLPNKTFGYKSIQDSYDAMLGIGFTADFKNITNFGGGMPVGEATIPFSSELLINIGDPLLKRINENETAKIYDASGEVKEDTYFDLGLGEVVYSEPGKEIHKVINIDFNNDDLEDIIVIFKDGTIKILKNYGGTNPFQNLGALTILADRISDVSIGDVDGNGYKDLIIWTESGWLRVYKNNGGVFDVDGYPVCINVNVKDGEVSEHPEKVKGLHQIFLEDMDLDGAMDIVTNDNLGFIKIFYGGTTENGGINYLSNNKYMCDEDWYERVEGSSQVVYQFGIKIDSNSHILDQSLIRWQGISDTPDDDGISPEDVGVNSNLFQHTGGISLDNISLILDSISKFNVSAAEDTYLQTERFKQPGFGVIPAYESGIDNEADIDYVEIGALTGEDPVKIYKTYEDLNNNPIDGNIIDTTGSLVKGDLVRVSVYITANDDFTGTFIDNIIGPWTIPLSEYNDVVFENFWFDADYVTRGYITSGQINDMANSIHWDLENARYMIDNISMKRGDRLKFSYGLLYNDYRAFDIDVSTLTGNNFSGVVLPSENLEIYSHDWYPDISTQPTDGCNDSMFVFFNNGSNNRREYTLKFMDLAKLVSEYNESSEGNGSAAQDEFFDGLGGSASNGDATAVMNHVSSFADIMENIDWQGMLSREGVDITNLTDIGTDIINGLTNKAVENIDKAIGGMCNGIDLGSLGLGGNGGCGLPIPFNQAFLGVGKYHVFGCYEIPILSETIGKGMPLLNIPGNWGPTVAGYIPAPGIFGFPAKVEGVDDFFLGSPVGTYPSMFRLYLMPTLTLQLGIALCFGPYTVGDMIPDPVASIAGNCVVFSVPLCSKPGSDDEGGNATTEIPYEYSLLKGCNKQNNPLYLGSNESASPFVFEGSSSNSQSFQPIIPAGSYAGGFINIEIEPETASSSYKESSPLDINSIILEGGAQVQNKIRGSQEQGLIEKIVKQRLDKQIKYILNNLTNFKISITWPDFAGLVGKMPSLQDIKNSMVSSDEEKQEKCEKNKGIWIEDEDGSWCKETDASKKLKCENRGMKWNPSDSTCVASDSALSKLDAWGQESLISRDQISSLSEYTNPFDNLAEAFSKTPLVNISTQDIPINIPLLTSEDITAYVSMSQTWVNRQSEIIKEWEKFFEDLIGVCSSGTMSVHGLDDIGDAITQLKELYKEASASAQGEGSGEEVLQQMQGKIDALQNLEGKYNLKNLGNYKIYDAKSGGFYILVKYSDGDRIQPIDVYIYFDPGNSNLSMFTSGFTLTGLDTNGGNSNEKAKVSIIKNGQPVNNSGIELGIEAKQYAPSSCANIFLDGTIDGLLNGFLNIHSIADSLTRAVKENIQTLEQYKLFPLELYERIHVVERYLGDISNLINSVLSTLSMWMETNANRYSQYVDAIVTLMTMLETYQLIIDFSADWTESCSTCTNDNYDQFSCKLGAICDMLGIELPIFEIPPTKIPSIYLDFSEIHVETDIKLPNFSFNPVSVPLPELPNLPGPPEIDFNLNLDEMLNGLLGIDLGQLMVQIGGLPIIPSPPTLPDLPSFIPSLEFELPLLPPAPKIPALPNKIQATIKLAKIISKILCIIKGKFGLVAENSIKAKVEQMTQRNYEIPFWDNMDLTNADWNSQAAAKMPSALASIFTGFASILQINEFKSAKLKGFDLSLQTNINLHFSFDDFYAFVDSVVGTINDVTNGLTELETATTDFVSSISRDLQTRLKACVNNPISIECNPDTAAIDVYNALVKDVEDYQAKLDNSFKGVKDIIALLEGKNSDLEDLQLATNELQAQLEENEELVRGYTEQLNNTNNETDRQILSDKIEYTNKTIQRLRDEIDANMERIRALQEEIRHLNEEYGFAIEKYNALKSRFMELSQTLSDEKERLLQIGRDFVDQINNQIKEAGENINFDDIKKLNASFLSGQKETDKKKEQDKQKRSDNLQGLYKELDGTISYVDYDADVNENNFKVLENMLTEIKDQTNNKDIKNRAQESLSLISMNRKIEANVDSINDVEKQYNTIVGKYKENNDDILDLIENDYDSFLVAVGNNDSKLVSNDSFNITLSTQLFDMDKSTIRVLSSQENVLKKYMDYNMNNLQGYINALENNSPQTLNMDENVYNLNKSYLKEVKDASDKAYAIITKSTIPSDDTNNIEDDEPVLLAQSAGGNGGGNSNTSSSNTTVDIANYIDGYTLNTKEGSFLLSNRDYINKFQSRFLLTDINKDGYSDLILWDEHNVYIKYRKGFTNYDNTKYNDTSHYYCSGLNSYDELLAASEDGFIKIGGIYVKVIDTNREVKNFKYNGQTFDTIKVSWLNSKNIGDNIDGYLVKMIHRVDQFNDKEHLLPLGNNAELFDKKYILVLPSESEVTGTSLEIEEGILDNIEQFIGTGNTIFGLSFYENADTTINLTVTDLPRNRQYSEIYTLNFVDNTYMISSSSSNQVVAGPQIIADDEGPEPTIILYRPATNTGVSEGTNLKGYVGTHYILQVDWEDNVALDRVWIANEMGETLVSLENIAQQTGHIEYPDLYFTGDQNIPYYIGGVDINGNEYVVNANLSITTPSIEIIDILRGAQNLSYNNGNVNYSNGNIGYSFDTNPIGSSIRNIQSTRDVPDTNSNAAPEDESMVTIVAQLDHDIDSGYVQFFRDRANNRRELLTGGIAPNKVSSFNVEPERTEIYGGYFDIGNDIALYSSNGDVVATINPENGKITKKKDSITIKLEYSSGRPIIKVIDGNSTIFWIIFSSIELTDLHLQSNDLSIQPLDNELFGDFYGGQAVLRNGEVIMYISPKGQIYTDANIYGSYDFDSSTNSVIYKFGTNQNGDNLGYVKVKIKSLLEY